MTFFWLCFGLFNLIGFLALILILSGGFYYDDD